MCVLWGALMAVRFCLPQWAQLRLLLIWELSCACDRNSCERSAINEEAGLGFCRTIPITDQIVFRHESIDKTAFENELREDSPRQT